MIWEGTNSESVASADPELAGQRPDLLAFDGINCIQWVLGTCD
jgi:hypothetical protein